MACWPLETKVMSRPMARSYSEALKQLRGAVLMPVTPVATEGHAEACSLGYHLRAAMLMSEDHAKAGVIPIWMAGAVMCSHGDIKARTAA